MTIQNFWPQEHVSYLGLILVDGLSFSEAAQRINERFGTRYTRNAVIGKSKRVGFKQPDKPWHRLTTITTPREKRKLKPRVQTDRQRKPARTPPFREPPRPSRETIQLRCAEIEPRHLSLLDLEPRDCRWPYGDQQITFCGHPILSGSYCSAHYQLSIGPGTHAERAAA